MAKKKVKKEPSKRVISLSLDKELIEAIQDIAQSEKRSVSSFVEECLIGWMEGTEPKDTGPLVPNEGIEKLLEQMVGKQFMDNLKFFGARAVSLYVDYTGISVKLGARSMNGSPDEPLTPVDGEIKIITNAEGQQVAQINAQFDSVLAVQ